MLKPDFKEFNCNEKGAKTILRNVRLAFVNVAEPNTMYSNKDGANNPIDGTYKVTCLIPEEFSDKVVKQIQKTVTQVCEMSDIFKSDAQRKKAIKTALSTGKDGSILKFGNKQTNKEGVVYDGMANMLTIVAKAKAIKTETGFKPKVSFKIVNRQNEPIPKHKYADEIYSGVWADVGINLKAYVSGQKVGVSVYLSGVMKLKDDVGLGGIDVFEVRDDIEDDEPDFTATEY